MDDMTRESMDAQQSQREALAIWRELFNLVLPALVARPRSKRVGDVEIPVDPAPVELAAEAADITTAALKEIRLACKNLKVPS